LPTKLLYGLSTTMPIHDYNHNNLNDKHNDNFNKCRV
jgi:hypothetical protein